MCPLINVHMSIKIYLLIHVHSQINTNLSTDSCSHVNTILSIIAEDLFNVVKILHRIYFMVELEMTDQTKALLRYP